MKLVRRILNRGKDLLYAPPLQGHWLARLRGKVICFLYHRVDDPSNNIFLTRGGSPVISPDEFRSDLRFLTSTGGVFLTFRDIAEGRFPSGDQHGVIICFDDCFRDNYTVGLPILEEFSIKATFFQTTAMVGGDRLIWEHALYWHGRDENSAGRLAKLAREVLKDLPPNGNTESITSKLREQVPVETSLNILARVDNISNDRNQMAAVAKNIYPTEDLVRQAHKLGHDIGSHGHNHYMRANTDKTTFSRELEISAQSLREILGEDAISFSYPFNSYLPGDDQVCRKFFRTAATVDKKLIQSDFDPMWVPRFTWPGPSRNRLRRRRWLLSGEV